MNDKQQIEEMAKDIYESKVAIDGSDMAFGLFDEDDHFHRIARFLYNANCRKLPENAVVLTREEYDGLKYRIEELEEALLDMVNQFCQMGEEGKLCHAFMSAEENAFDVLDIKYGAKASTVWKRYYKKWGRK